MLAPWLGPAPADAGRGYLVVEVHELDPTDRLGIATEVIRDAYFDLEYLEGISARYGWRGVESVLKTRDKAHIQIRRGDFGEAIAVRVLREFGGYEVPVEKLRYKITAGQSLPATDCIAIRAGNDGSLVEVCLVESKLRTGKDPGVASSAYRQLTDDASNLIPDALLFTSRQLRASNHALSSAFDDYMFSRTTNVERLTIMICQEATTWDPDVLDELDGESPPPTLTIYPQLIADLAELCTAVFSAFGESVEVLDDDE